MPHERMTAARETCPCGAGHIRIDITYNDSDWGMTDQSWEGVVECDRCAPLYGFIRAGRGVDVVRIEDKQRRERLLQDAAQSEIELMNSDQVASVIDKIAAEFDALPTMTAKYRLAVQLGIETATLPTFRKHTRSIPAHRWLAWTFPKDRDAERSLNRLLAVFGYLGADTTLIEHCRSKTKTLRDNALKMPKPVMSLGPINLFAALSRSPGL